MSDPATLKALEEIGMAVEHSTEKTNVWVGALKLLVVFYNVVL